jgi:hypothetical protein
MPPGGLTPPNNARSSPPSSIAVSGAKPICGRTCGPRLLFEAKSLPVPAIRGGDREVAWATASNYRPAFGHPAVMRARAPANRPGRRRPISHQMEKGRLDGHGLALGGYERAQPFWTCTKGAKHKLNVPPAP